MMIDKKIDITNKYHQEILDIINRLNALEQGRVYELSGVKMDGFLSTNVEKLKQMIYKLITKIEYGEDSINDELSKIFDIKL